MKLALLLMLWLTGCAENPGLRREPRPSDPGDVSSDHGWTNPRIVIPGHPQRATIQEI